jgi:pantothenate kinase-related protein Tda10
MAISRASAPLVIGVAGGSGSGKTTVSHAILERVGRERIAFLQVLPFRAESPERLRRPEGTRMKHHALAALAHSVAKTAVCGTIVRVRKHVNN